VNFDPDLRHYFEGKVIAERGLSLKAIHTAAAARGQFHQHFKRSFYVLRSQKRKKYSQVINIFLCFWDLCA
jgi:hypothetical protein